MGAVAPDDRPQAAAENPPPPGTAGQSSIDWYTTARKSASGRSKPTMCCVMSTPTISSTGSTQ
jgi:hypothetical protein